MIETGGSAFPETTIVGPNQKSNVHQGMTLRDYFAAKAMQGIIPNYWQMVMDCTYDDWPTAIPDLAKEAYEMADTMLKARGQ